MIKNVMVSITTWPAILMMEIVASRELYAEPAKGTSAFATAVASLNVKKTSF